MQKIGAAHDEKTPAQVALNWTLLKGTIPIPGAKNVSQVQQNAGALGWELTSEEVAELDQMSNQVVNAH
jgi:pyridoxine 4-dehydrogenase